MEIKSHLYTFIDKEFYYYNLPYPFHQGIGGICLPFNDSLQTLYQEELFIMPCFGYIDMMVIESTNDPILNTQVTIFPNPASDLINLEVEDLTPQSIRVYNSLGQLELLELNPQAQMQVNVSNLISGMHYFEITFEQGTVVKPVMIR